MRKTRKGQQTPVGNQTRRATARAPPVARAAVADFFCRHRGGTCRSWYLLGGRWADAALKAHAERSDGNAAIKLVTRGVVVARVSLEVQRVEKPSLQRPWFVLRRRRRSRLCEGPSKVSAADPMFLPLAIAGSRL